MDVQSMKGFNKTSIISDNPRRNDIRRKVKFVPKPKENKKVIEIKRRRKTWSDRSMI
mgnify:CR=1 FL=1